MTNYNDILDLDWRERDRYGRLPGDKHYDGHQGESMIASKKSKDTKAQRCSENTSVKALFLHARKLKTMLKAAETDGLCLDELLECLKELEK